MIELLTASQMARADAAAITSTSALGAMISVPPAASTRAKVGSFVRSNASYPTTLSVDQLTMGW